MAVSSTVRSEPPPRGGARTSVDASLRAVGLVLVRGPRPEPEQRKICRTSPSVLLHRREVDVEIAPRPGDRPRRAARRAGWPPGRSPGSTSARLPGGPSTKTMREVRPLFPRIPREQLVAVAPEEDLDARPVLDLARDQPVAAGAPRVSEPASLLQEEVRQELVGRRSARAAGTGSRGRSATPGSQPAGRSPRRTPRAKRPQGLQLSSARALGDIAHQGRSEAAGPAKTSRYHSVPVPGSRPAPGLRAPLLRPFGIAMPDPSGLRHGMRWLAAPAIGWTDLRRGNPLEPGSRPRPRGGRGVLLEPGRHPGPAGRGGDQLAHHPLPLARRDPMIGAVIAVVHRGRVAEAIRLAGWPAVVAGFCSARPRSSSSWHWATSRWRTPSS